MKSIIKKLRFLTPIVIGVIFFVISCKKTAGDGGNSSISGIVWLENWTPGFTALISRYAATDYDVYIIYGDDVSYSDRIRTSYNGQFEFKYLRKGNYKIYAFSKDKTLLSPSGEMSIVKEIKISDKKQKVSLDTIIVYKSK